MSVSSCMHMGNGKIHLFLSSCTEDFCMYYDAQSNWHQIAHCTNCSSIHFNIAIAPKNFNRSNGKELQKIQ